MNNHLFNCQQTISALGDRLVVFNKKESKAIWMSDMFFQTFPELETGTSIEKVIESIGINHSRKEYFKNIIIGSIKTETSPNRIQCGRFDAQICQIDNIYSLIRLHDSSLVDEAHGRYLEDREKLIFTAGSITVCEMASTIAHEINQPIGAINNLLHGIRDRLLTDDTYDQQLIEAIDKSIEQTQYTADIICRIRDYTSSRQPKIKEININILIDKCVSLMDWEVRNTNVQITHKKFVHSALIQGDEVMLQQVIVNLIRNGIESMLDDENAILITTKKADDYLKITIQDNGKGISNDELNTVFIPFSSRKSSGMGIGLNICRSFIEMHCGKIWLTQNEERGCTSHILLPTHNEGSL